jgi:hypothetical protein
MRLSSLEAKLRYSAHPSMPLILIVSPRLSSNSGYISVHPHPHPSSSLLLNIHLLPTLILPTSPNLPTPRQPLNHPRNPNGLLPIRLLIRGVTQRI